MNDIAQALSPNALVLSAWRVLVWASAAYLLALGVLIFGILPMPLLSAAENAVEIFSR